MRKSVAYWGSRRRSNINTPKARRRGTPSIPLAALLQATRFFPLLMTMITKMHAFINPPTDASDQTRQNRFRHVAGASYISRSRRSRQFACVATMRFASMLLALLTVAVEARKKKKEEPPPPESNPELLVYLMVACLIVPLFIVFRIYLGAAPASAPAKVLYGRRTHDLLTMCCYIC